MENQKSEFWNKSHLGEVQKKQKFYLKDYERYFFEKISKQATIKSMAIFGCGNGREIKDIVRILNPEVLYAYDFSEVLLETLRQSFPDGKEGNTEIVIKQQDFGKEDWEIPALDLAYISNCTIGYVGNRKQRDNFLAKISKSLTSQGLFFLELSAMYNYNPLRNAYIIADSVLGVITGKKEWGDKGIVSSGFKSVYHNYTKAEIRKELASHKFSILEMVKKSEFRKSREPHDTISVLAVKN